MARASKAKTGKKSAPKRTARKAAKPKAVKARKAGAATKPAKAKVAKKARRVTPRKSKAEMAHETLVANARHALELKNSAPEPFRPKNRTPSKGMPPLPNETIAPAGAIEAEEAYSAKGRAHRSG